MQRSKLFQTITCEAAMYASLPACRAAGIAVITPFYDDGIVQILHGDCRVLLPQLAAGSIHSCVTSPPYWNLRDYGGGAWVGGDEGCDHAERKTRGDGGRPERNGGYRNGVWLEGAWTKHEPNTTSMQYRDTCGKCGATRQDQQMGLESTPAAFVAALTAVFEEVRRCLRTDGNAWLNLGDSFKNKQQQLIPHRVALSLQDAGWWLRSTIVWHKENAMPSSVTDRPTDAHEYIFLLAKAEKYYYDAAAIAEVSTQHGQGTRGAALDHKLPPETNNGRNGSTLKGADRTTRNRRSVWTINSQPWPGSHFAVMPEKLVDPCVLAGVPSQVCSNCGSPWVRQVEKGEPYKRPDSGGRVTRLAVSDAGQGTNGTGATTLGRVPTMTTTGFAATCRCNAETIPGTVLDPFCGSGTVGVVAKKLGRKAILVEQNLDYCRMAADRIEATPTPFPYEVFG